MSIYVFDDSEQKDEFKVRIKQSTKLYEIFIVALFMILEGCKNSMKWVMDSQNFVFLGCSL